MNASEALTRRRLQLRRPTALLAALTLGSALLAMPAMAQSGATPPSPPPPMAVRYAAAVQGDIARIQVIQPRGGWGTGTVAWTTSDSLGLQRTRQRDTVAIGRDNIARMEVQRAGQRSGGAIALGIVGGAVLGGALGAAFGVLAECGGDGCSDEYLGGVAGFVIGGTIGVIGGGVGGGLLAARVRGPRWEPLAP